MFGLSVPDAVLVGGFFITLLAAWRGSADAGKTKEVAGAASAAPVSHDVLEIDARYTRAMDSNTAATREMAQATHKIGAVLERWLSVYERDKEDGRFEALEMQMAQIYGRIAQPAETRPLPRRKPRTPK